MSLSVVLEVVIGLSFLFAILSLVASGASELISSLFRLRARTLKQGVQNLLDNPADAIAIYEHPVIRSLYRKRRAPSSMPNDKFALALLDTKVRPAVEALAGATEGIEGAIEGIGNERLKKTLDVLWRDSKKDADRFRKGVENWFDDSMERVSGWYKRLVQIILFSIGLAVAVGLNINTLTVAQSLWTNAPVRAAVVAQAQKMTPPEATDNEGVKSALDNIQQGLSTIDELGLPIGRPNGGPATPFSPRNVTGWLITAVAISFGAPFWFDLLGRVARLRSTGVRNDPSVPRSAESEEEAPPKPGGGT